MMGSGMNCDHWRTDCTKCGRRYHLCDGTTQCGDCRSEYYVDDPAGGPKKFIFYRDTRHDGETNYQRLTAALHDLMYLGFIGNDLADMEADVYRARPDLEALRAPQTGGANDGQT